MKKRNVNKKTRVQCNVRLPAELVEWWSSTAAAAGMSMNQVVERWLSAGPRLRAVVFDENTAGELEEIGGALAEELGQIGIECAYLLKMRESRARRLENLMRQSKEKGGKNE